MDGVISCVALLNLDDISVPSRTWSWVQVERPRKDARNPLTPVWVQEPKRKAPRAELCRPAHRHPSPRPLFRSPGGLVNQIDIEPMTDTYLPHKVPSSIPPHPSVYLNKALQCSLAPLVHPRRRI